MSVLRQSAPRHLVALGLACMTALSGGTVYAADYLRGSYSGEAAPQSAAPDWSGVYGGVHAGISAGKIDPNQINKNNLANLAWPLHPTTSQIADYILFRNSTTMHSSFGAFIGFNAVWDDVVLGFEADYSRSNFANSSSHTESRRLTAAGLPTSYYNTDVTSTGKAVVKDWVTLRGRAGYAMGHFMPYLTAGVALGNASSNYSARVTQTEMDTNGTPGLGDDIVIAGPSTSTGTIKHRGISYGGAVGAGIDMQLIPNTFLRAEWQYIQFASGGNRPEISINTARIGGGVKF
jgi:outer membrane immunogenic protein